MKLQQTPILIPLQKTGKKRLLLDSDQRRLSGVGGWALGSCLLLTHSWLQSIREGDRIQFLVKNRVVGVLTVSIPKDRTVLVSLTF